MQSNKADACMQLHAPATSAVLHRELKSQGGCAAALQFAKEHAPKLSE